MKSLVSTCSVLLFYVINLKLYEYAPIRSDVEWFQGHNCQNFAAIVGSTKVSSSMSISFLFVNSISHQFSALITLLLHYFSCNVEKIICMPNKKF